MSRDDHRRHDAELLRLRQIVEQRPKTTPILYLRAVSAVGTLLGIAAMIFTAFFGFAAVLLYLSALVGVVDVCREKDLRTRTRVALLSVIVVLVALFTKFIILYPAPIEFRSYWIDNKYPVGTKADGIEWRSGMSELRVTIQNPNERDYSDFEFVIAPSDAIVDINQTTSIPCTPIQTDVVSPPHDSQGNVYHSIFKGGRFRCDKLPAHSAMEFVLAVGNIDQWKKNLQGGKLEDAFKNLPQSGPDMPWNLLGPKRKPQSLRIGARYVVTFKPHSEAREVAIEG